MTILWGKMKVAFYNRGSMFPLKCVLNDGVP